MTIHKLHRNPSTGKLSRNPATGKLSVVVAPGCVGCGGEPDSITVTFSGIAARDGCSLNLLTFKDNKWTGVPDINSPYILGSSFQTACLWTQSVSVGVTRKIYDSFDGSCSGNLIQTDEYTSMTIAFSVTGVTGTVTLHGDGASSAGARLYQKNNPTSPDSPCMNTSDAPSQLLESSSSAAFGGTAQIEDGS